MMIQRRPWQEELAIIDQTMRAISGVTDPESLVDIYWNGIGKLIPMHDYLALSRRNVEAPFYLITRSSRFTVHHNPWTQRDLLPRLSGGLLGELAYANKPVFIDDLPQRLTADDPAHFYLQGFKSLIALPQYDDGQGLNVTAMLLKEGTQVDPQLIPMLHWQAGLFGRGTQNLVLRNQLESAMESLDRELQSVGEIQRSLLPSELPSIPGFEVATYYRTSARAGGDYYDFFPLADGEWGIFIADVSGHGTPAAVLMAITHAIAHSRPGTQTPPPDLLKHLNDRLVLSYARGGTFVTAFYAILNPARRTLTYARAGHNPPRLIRGSQVISLEENGGLPLGILTDQCYGQATVQLEPGDLLVLYTDGITEAASPPSTSPGVSPAGRELFGTARLDALLVDCRPGSATACIERIRAELADFSQNAPPTDDQTLIALRCT
ncbi:MAG: serine/threonine-protein phosphatase [Burkholderiales bacterium]|nr:serine/threonine-protein phosphatase [Phycisphaerae bacterium]